MPLLTSFTLRLQVLQVLELTDALHEPARNSALQPPQDTQHASNTYLSSVSELYTHHAGVSGRWVGMVRLGVTACA